MNMKIIRESTLDYLLERYMGKSKNLIMAEKEMNKVIKKIKERDKGEFNTRTVNNSIEMVKYREYIAKEFNIKRLIIDFVYDKNPNALTLPKVVNTTDPRKDNETTGNVYVFLHTGLITSGDMTSGEILALTLHELGHNFYKSYIHAVGMFNTIFLSGNGLLTAGLQQSPLIGEYYKLLQEFKGDLIGSVPFIDGMYNIFHDIFSIIVSMIPKSSLTLGYNITTMLGNPVGWTTRYKIEKESDGFAVDAGFGQELATALDKISGVSVKNPTNYIMDIPVLGVVYELDMVATIMVSGAFGTYPSLDKRLVLAMDRLEKHSKDPSLPEDLRRKAKNDLKRTKEYYDSRVQLGSVKNKLILQTYLKAARDNKIPTFDIRDLLEYIDKGY